MAADTGVSHVLGSPVKANYVAHGARKTHFDPSGVPREERSEFFVVPPAGFEPATIGLEVHCSIQLSYRGMLHCRG